MRWCLKDPGGNDKERVIFVAGVKMTGEGFVAAEWNLKRRVVS